MAQWITRLPTEQKIPGSNPGKFGHFLFFIKKKKVFQTIIVPLLNKELQVMTAKYLRIQSVMCIFTSDMKNVLGDISASSKGT